MQNNVLMPLLKNCILIRRISGLFWIIPLLCLGQYPDSTALPVHPDTYLKDNIADYRLYRAFWNYKYDQAKNLDELLTTVSQLNNLYRSITEKFGISDSLLIVQAYLYYDAQRATYSIYRKHDFRTLPEDSMRMVISAINNVQDNLAEKYMRAYNRIPEKKRDQRLSRIYKGFSFKAEFEQFKKDLETKPAPDFTCLNTTGDSVRLSEYRGSVVILHFWSMYSTPCLENLPELVYLHETNKDRGLDIISINWDRLDDAWNRQVLVNFAKKTGMNWDIIADGNDKVLFDKYFIRSVPTLFLIDRDGYVIKKDMELQEGNLKKEVRKLFP